MTTKAGKARSRGILIIEAVTASFLLIFAFMASVALFDSAIRWESRSSNERLAALVAERKLQDIKSQSQNVPSGSDFGTHIDNLIAGPHPDYPESPGFSFSVQSLVNIHPPRASDGETPPPGFHSPCSMFHASRADLASGADPNGDQQRNFAYQSYPYTRPMNNSFRLVEITVEYGGDREFRLVSLIGESVVPGSPTPVISIGQTGAGTLGSDSARTNFALTVQVGGRDVQDVSAIWGITPDSGSAAIETMDSTGTNTQLRRVMPVGPDLSSARVAAKIRYAGKEYFRETTSPVVLGNAP